MASKSQGAMSGIFCGIVKYGNVYILIYIVYRYIMNLFKNRHDIVYSISLAFRSVENLSQKNSPQVCPMTRAKGPLDLVAGFFWSVTSWVFWKHLRVDWIWGSWQKCTPGSWDNLRTFINLYEKNWHNMWIHDLILSVWNAVFFAVRSYPSLCFSSRRCSSHQKAVVFFHPRSGEARFCHTASPGGSKRVEGKSRVKTINPGADVFACLLLFCWWDFSCVFFVVFCWVYYCCIKFPSWKEDHRIRN